MFPVLTWAAHILKLQVQWTPVILSGRLPIFWEETLSSFQEMDFHSKAIVGLELTLPLAPEMDPEPRNDG